MHACPGYPTPMHAQTPAKLSPTVTVPSLDPPRARLLPTPASGPSTCEPPLLRYATLSRHWLIPPPHPPHVHGCPLARHADPTITLPSAETPRAMEPVYPPGIESS